MIDGRRLLVGGGVLLFLFAAGGCGGGSETGPPNPTAASLTAEGWRAFERDAFAEARGRFEEALALQPGFPEALAGLGWVALREQDPAAARSRFDEALTANGEHEDARGGRVLAGAGLDLYELVVADAQFLLSRDPGYVFAHDPAYASSDIRWLLARAALDLGLYVLAAGELAVLAPESGLDPEAAGFLEEALTLLEVLRSSV